MATKRKPANRKKVSQTPVTPPQSVGEVLLQSCMSDLNNEHAAAYAIGIYRRGEMSETDKTAFCEALYLFAVLGWTYWNHAKEQNES